MERILLRLELQEYNKVDRIFIFYPYNALLNTVIKEIPGARYSGRDKCWHIPAVKEIVKILSEKVKNIAELDITHLKQQLLSRKEVPNLIKRNSSELNISSLCQEN